jgi:hypothetical protein
VYRFGGPAERGGPPEGYSCCCVAEGRSVVMRGHLKETRGRWARRGEWVDAAGGVGGRRRRCGGVGWPSAPGRL